MTSTVAQAHVCITALVKSGGPLTKRIAIDPGSGRPASDASDCKMSNGTAHRVSLTFPEEFASFIGALDPNEAIALGDLRKGVPDQAEVVTKRRLQAMNGTAKPNVVARSNDYFTYAPDRPALALLDYDSKNMPEAVRLAVSAAGGVWQALATAAPGLADAVRIVRRSTSAGLRRDDTGEEFPGSDGLHHYVAVQDGTDIEAFLKRLHDRCWLAGYGWWAVSAAGSYLERSLVDTAVGRPERLVFEAAPLLAAPLSQDKAAREPVIEAPHGAQTVVDTRKAVPPLSPVEAARLRSLMTDARVPLRAEATRKRAEFVARRAGELMASNPQIAENEAQAIVLRQLDGVLLPDIVLPFDDPDLHGHTVRQVLADPAAYLGHTLADPLDGEQGGKAKVMGTAAKPFINSFAGGGRRYELRKDARFVRATIEAAPEKDAPQVLTDHLFDAEVGAIEIDDLTNFARERAGVGKRAMQAHIRETRTKHARAAREARSGRTGQEDDDARPILPAPAPDAERLPVMQLFDDLLGNSTADPPPLRNLAGQPVEVSGTGGSGAGAAGLPATSLPGGSLAIRQHTAFTLSHLIERHARFTQDGRFVAPNLSHVTAYAEYRESTLPRIKAIVTVPVMLRDGTLLDRNGFDRERGVQVAIDPALPLALPSGPVTDQQAAEALHLLADDWLGDVLTDWAGKIVLIAFALTIIERTQLPERPVFVINAGKAGGGKTTAAAMVATCAIGQPAAAAQWSEHEEERRKALFGYLLQGQPTVNFDNVSTGLSFRCPCVEKACTSPTYTDRVLGTSEPAEVSAATVLSFTGNNVTPIGDLALRSLICHLTVPDAAPENRAVRRDEPVLWTAEQRPALLSALYTRRPDR